MLEVLNFLNLLLLLALLILFLINEDIISYLIIIEFIWILMYIICVFLGLSFDVPNLICLTFFILILAGLEFAIGIFIYYYF